MAVSDKQWLLWVSELQALAQSGLTYTTNAFDIERFERIRGLSAELASAFSEISPKDVDAIFSLKKGYATPQVDVRSFVLQDGRVLMVRERSDGLWTIPGGFADVNESPSQAAARETVEESGYVVKPIRLLALWDTLSQNHPLSWPHIYKCVFLCEMVSGEMLTSLEISEIGFFALDNLPPLSTPRITEKQIHILHTLVTDSSSGTLFD